MFKVQSSNSHARHFCHGGYCLAGLDSGKEITAFAGMATLFVALRGTR